MEKIEKMFVVADFLWSLFIVFPEMVVFWGGTWGLMNVYFQNATNKLCGYALGLDQNYQNTNNSGILTTCGTSISIEIGSLVCLIFFYLLPMLGREIPVNNRSLKHVLVSRSCIYFMACGVIFFWRGFWLITDVFIKSNLKIFARHNCFG